MTQLSQAQIEQRREAARARWRGYAKVAVGALAGAAAIAGAAYLMRGRSKFKGFGARGAKVAASEAGKPIGAVRAGRPKGFPQYTVIGEPGKIYTSKPIKAKHIKGPLVTVAAPVESVAPKTMFSGTLRAKNPVDLAARRARGDLQFSSRWVNRDADKWNHLPSMKQPFQAKRPDTWGLQSQNRQRAARERLAQIDEKASWQAHRERVAQSAAAGSRTRAESARLGVIVASSTKKPGKAMTMDQVRASLYARLKKRQAGTPLSEAERKQRSDAAKARWQEHRGTTVANDIELNSKGFPRQRAVSATRPRDESGRVRPLNADEMGARLEQRAAKLRAGKVGARWDARGNLRDKTGSFTSHPWAGAIGEETAAHVLGPTFAPLGRKIGESIAIGAENPEHRGALVGGGLGAGAAAVISSKPVKRFVGQQIGRLIGQYKIRGRIAGTVGGKLGRILSRGIAGRTNVRGSGLLIGGARSLLSRRLIGVPLVGAGVYLGSRAGRLFQNDKR